MRKPSWIGRAGALSVALSLAASSCSNGRSGSGLDPDGATGTVSMTLIPVSGVTVNSVNYVLTGMPAIAGTPLPAGVIPTPGTSQTLNFGVPVPVGTGYVLNLSAVSAESGDDITCTGASAPFDVLANNPTNITLTLMCRDNSTGQVITGVNVETSACPRLHASYAIVIPRVIHVGESAAVDALGQDLDGKPVSYVWSVPATMAAAGSFATANNASTRFACAQGMGAVPLTVTLSNGECSTTLRTLVACVTADPCGNGVLEPGEDCDPNIPAGQPGGGKYGCPADCTVACGDGVIEAPAEDCELPAGVPTPTCSAECRSRLCECGDGFLCGAEVCDGATLPPGTPAGSVCSADCSKVIPPHPTCGDMVLGVGEECEPPSSETCSDTCQRVASDACVTCEQNGACGELSDACNAFSGVDKTSCYKVAECIADSNCGDGASTLTSCFCGNLTTANCIAAPNSGPGSPAGLCAGFIRQAMSVGGVTATNNDVLLRYIDTSFPGGAAIARYNCDKLDPACISVCGF